MFTGIIQSIGCVASRIAHAGGDATFEIQTGSIDASTIEIGDSICVCGVCLTAIEVAPDGFKTDVSVESLSRTMLGALTTGDAVNLELALTPTTRLGGHLVSGHVDGVGEVVSRREDARSVRFDIRVPDPLARYVAEKGSICIDGVSLTVNGVQGTVFDVNIVPHTLEATTLGGFAPQRMVNVEVDQIARYVERLIAFRNA